jgi:hypothetical protein
MDINWITATDIDAWVRNESRRAQEILPDLLVRLIHASSNKIDNINVPDIQSSGYDITLAAGEQTNYFPNGKSVWELGVEENANGKFKSDIAKRSKCPLGVDIAETVFIFATLRIWKHRDNPIEKAINEAKKKYSWKDIRIIDAQELSRWLEYCPSVAVWFSITIGKYMPGVVSAEHYWDDYGNNTDPKLTPDCLKIGREDQSTSLLQWLKSPVGYKIIRAESSLEAKLFTVATILNMEEEQRKKLLSRIVIVENSTAWQEVLNRAKRSVILIPIFPIGDISCPRDLNILFPVSKYDFIGDLDDKNNYIDLPTLKKPQFDQLLTSLGYDIASHASISYDTKLCFSSLYRKITTNPTRKKPEWVKGDNTNELIPAMFAGSWNDNYPGDRRVIEILSDNDYSEYIDMMHKWINIEDAPILIVEHNNYTVSRKNMWNILFSKIKGSDMINIKTCVSEIFSQIDSTFELPEEQWPFANIYGKKHKYSQGIIHGLMISLVMLAKRDRQEYNLTIPSPKSWVDSVVKQVLEPISTWQHWYTIAPSLPLLAEASPIAIMERIEDAVNKNDKEFWRLFNQSNDQLLGRNYYTHILWALEKLVWDNEFAARAIRLIARIGEKDIKYNITNSPHNSLNTIFCLWYPQTCLNTDERIELMEIIVSLCPNTGWKLLNSLIPRGGSVSLSISRPRWREFNDIYSKGIPENEYNANVEKVLYMCLKYVGYNKERWKDIIDAIDLFWDRFDLLSDKLQETCDNLSENDILELCEKLREKISWHRRFVISEGSAPKDHTDKWESLLGLIVPNTIGKYRYLLKSAPNTLNPISYNKENGIDHKQMRLDVFNLRKAAFEAIVEKWGEMTIIEFCTEAEDMQDWAQIIVESILNNQYDFQLLKLIHGLSHRLHSAILWVLYSNNNLDILLDAIEKEQSLTNYEIAEMMCCTPLSMDVWLKLEEMGDEIIDYYWENVRAFRLDIDTLTMEYYIEKLLEHIRPFSAINIIYIQNIHNTRLIINALLTFLEHQEHIENDGLSVEDIQSHVILSLFNRLYDDVNIDDMDVARLEIMYMPFFRFDGKPKCLIRCFTKMPDLYIEFISKACKQDNTDDTDTAIAVESHVVEIAHTAIERFTEIPGCNENLTDEDYFNNWVHRAQQTASESGYTIAFKICLGRLLSYSPHGSDGIFPHEIVRNYLENNSSETIIRHFIIEKRNQRGVHIATYGETEEQIAQKYKNDSTSLRIKYPRTASILDKLSETYFSDSRQEQLKGFRDL